MKPVLPLIAVAPSGQSRLRQLGAWPRLVDARLTALKGAGLACLLLAAQLPAHAITPLVPLAALGEESMDLNELAWQRVQYGVGTLNYNLNPGCAAAGASCDAQSTLTGPAGGPAVDINVNQAPFSGAGGGSENFAELYYYVTYSGPSGAIAGNYYPVTINMSDTLDPGAGQAQAYFGFGVAQTSANGFPALATGQLGFGVGSAGDDGSMLAVTESLTDCASGRGYSSSNACMVGAGNDYNNAKALGTLHNVMMQAGTMYLVDIWVAVSPANTAASASLDPTFSAASGSFAFSPGVINAVPEPDGSALALSGLTALGLGMAAFKRRA